jgi:arginine/ornithine transport system substrate-binding protein
MQRRTLALAATLISIACTSLCSPAFAQAPDWKKHPHRRRRRLPAVQRVGPDGKLKGFDIDIALALCAEMKAECTLVQQDWDGMIPALQSRKFDAIIASMAITDERKKVVNFTDKYYNTPARLVAKAGAEGRGHARRPEGQAHRRAAQHHPRPLRHRHLQGQRDRALRQGRRGLPGPGRRPRGRGAGRFGGAGRRLPEEAAGQGLQLLRPPLRRHQVLRHGSGIAVRKADTDLQARFNAAIKAIRANGVYKKMQDKYFDFDVYGN